MAEGPVGVAAGRTGWVAVSAEDDLLYRDLTEAEGLVIDALSSIEDIESGGWPDDGVIENAANSAASELGDLLKAIQARRDQIPPAEEVLR